MTILFDATLALAKVLMPVKEGSASGAGAAGKTTLVDTTRQEPDDYFHKANVAAGTIWLTSGTNDETSRALTDYTQSTGTFTFAAVTAQTAADETYSAAPIDFSRDELIGAINAARQTIGAVPQEYTNSSYVTVADQMIYDLPTGVYNVKRVEIAQATSSPYLWRIHNNWYEINNDIVFNEESQPGSSDYLIRLTYVVPPSDLTTDAGEISNYVHIDVLKWVAAVHALRQKRNDKKYTTLLNEALQREQQMLSLHPIPKMEQDWRFSRWSI
jgi:hypothetical protein